MRESLLGPCSLLMVARAHTHTYTLRAHPQMTRAAAAAAMHKDTGLAHRLTDVALALHAIGARVPETQWLCRYLVLLHSPDTCSSSSCCFDAMRMRVLAACAAPHSLHDWFLNNNSAESVFIHPPPASPPWQPVTENFCTPWIELRETKCLYHPREIVLFQNTFAASFCRATPWTSVMRELPLALPLRPWGIAHSLAAETPPALQCTSQVPHRL